jgi:predicted peptidase
MLAFPAVMKIFLIGMVLIGAAQSLVPVDGFEGRVYRKGKNIMPYRLFIPAKYDKTNKYPLVIWLHGAGGAGTDNLKQIANDNYFGPHLWSNPQNQMKYPSFVLVPQTTGSWAEFDPNDLSPEEGMMLAVLQSLEKEFSIDPQRIYLTGQSNGGNGTWDLITKRPALFAAAVPLCGGGNTTLVARIAHLPIWAFHGEKDDVIPVASSRNMIAGIKQRGGNPKYTEYPGVGHDVWLHALKEPGLVDWLFAQHR